MEGTEGTIMTVGGKNISNMDTMQLVVVDCQNDFIDGSLAVDGAKEAVNNIVKFIKEHRVELKSIIMTMDWHPYNHCSFKENGGEWPAHCMHFSYGAALYEPLAEQLFDYRSTDDTLIHNYIKIGFITKGDNPYKEEYGAFEPNNPNEDVADDIKSFLDKDKPVIISGIAGDYCVLETAKNLIKRGYRVKFLLDGIASIDGGTKLNEFIKEQEELSKMTI